MFILNTLEEAEAFVKQQQDLGNNVYWDNYDIVFHRVSLQGIYSVYGAFRNGQWGYENRFPVTAAGTWEIDPKNVRRSTPINV